MRDFDITLVLVTRLCQKVVRVMDSFEIEGNLRMWKRLVEKERIEL